MSLFPAYSGASPAPNSLFITFFFSSLGYFHFKPLQISLLFSCNQTFFVFLFSEILAISSRAKKDLFKMVSKFNSELRTLKKTWEVKTTLFFFFFLPFIQVHLPSLTVFSNWPTSRTPLRYVNAFDFSPNSGYISIGNDRGKALLYRYALSRLYP